MSDEFATRNLRDINKLIDVFLEDLDKLEVEDATNQHNRTYEAIEASDIDILRKKWKNYNAK